MADRLRLQLKVAIRMTAGGAGEASAAAVGVLPTAARTNKEARPRNASHADGVSPVSHQKLNFNVAVAVRGAPME